MPRTARIVIPQIPHHITQRGNNRQEVFFVDEDRKVYLSLLKEHSDRYGVEILGWCLMTNHIHLIARPATEEGMAKAIGRTHFRYTQYINRMHGRSGHLWQNRFYSCPLGKLHFWKCLRYVEQNPLRAGMVKKAVNYKFSSAAAHLNSEDATGLLDISWWRQASARIDWNEVLRNPLPEEQLKQIRLNTHTGRPLAEDSLISKLETVVGRRLRPLPIGRPKKVIK
jgi:putative transposase